ncbi:serine hydrolase domain-containing protein [Amycolatopsis cihanbeyliensis]|uniref:CubicO group peptidase (Beta-lactamase class C family) n=1 Tax=Amycolatopsis cihanbeyliensis TaxID=1128664 RepID=A0A542DM83_AMYCI|nr:serine hydrolase domain-containing protein [Amycolatopsis cihanbeyliensis]TQJ04201.1 CubicO group peptidase (beta-lactamase class C family) [Amycolatopsis cihanbeyliensis]
MRDTFRRCVLATAVGLLVLAGLPLPAAHGATAGDLPERVHRFMESYLDSTGLPGAAVAITREDRVLLAAGYGHDSTGARVTDRTRFPVGSVSKSFTALAVLRLVEAGRVELDTPVRRYLPAFRLADPRGARITVRQLLNQTSGMSDSGYPDARMPPPETPAEAVARLRAAELSAEPGTTWRYYNPNWHVAARLVEVVSSRPYAGYLRDQVFRPLGMADTSAVLGTGDARVPVGHAYTYGIPFVRSEPGQFVAGSHGVVSTAADLANWLIMQGGHGRRLVSARSLDTMHTPTGPDGNEGMGWFVNTEGGRTEISHDGAWFTHTARQVLLPGSGHGVAVLANTGIGLAPTDASAIADGVLAAIEGETPALGPPVALVVDLVLAALTLAATGLAVRGILRRRRWADRRLRHARWRAALRLVPYGLPVLCLALLPQLVDRIFQGPSISWAQLLTGAVALVTFAGLTATGCVGVVLARLHALLTGTRHHAEDPGIS